MLHGIWYLVFGTGYSVTGTGQGGTWQSMLRGQEGANCLSITPIRWGQPGQGCPNLMVKMRLEVVVKFS